MPYRKLYRKKASTVRRRKIRPFKMFRRPRIAIPRTYFYKQSVSGSDIIGLGSRTITQSSVASHYSMEFRVANLGNWASMSALYDQFCLSKVVLKLIPIVQMNSVQPLSGSTNIGSGLMGTIVDVDDSATLTSLEQYEQYPSWRYQAAISGRTHTRVVVPGCRIGTTQTGGGIAPSNVKKKQWIDCTYGTTSFYGIKIYLDPYNNVNAPASYQIQAIYYIKFRNVR